MSSEVSWERENKDIVHHGWLQISKKTPDDRRHNMLKIGYGTNLYKFELHSFDTKIDNKLYFWPPAKRLSESKRMWRMRSSASYLEGRVYYCLHSNNEKEIEYIDKHFRDHNWAKIIPQIDDIISNLKKSILPPVINHLIKISMVAYNEMKGDAFLEDTLQTLMAYFKEIKILFDVGMVDDALKTAIRCKEIVEFASVISKAANEEGLPPLGTSSLMKVDEIDGRPVYTVRE